MNMLEASLKEEGTFAERKLARIAAGPQQFTFEVVALVQGAGEKTVGSFPSLREAREFAYQSLNGFTGAQRALFRMTPRNEIWHSAFFSVVRINATTGERKFAAGM